APLQAGFVQHVGVCVALGASHGIRQHIPRDRGSTPDIGMSADANELMDRTKRADNCPLLNGDMTCERGSIDQHGVIANQTVVPNMRVRHDQSMAADAGNSSAFRGSAIDGYIFADHIVVAHLEPGGLTGEGYVLRVPTNHGERIDSVVTAQPRRSVQDYLRNKLAVLA